MTEKKIQEVKNIQNNENFIEKNSEQGSQLQSSEMEKSMGNEKEENIEEK